MCENRCVKANVGKSKVVVVVVMTMVEMEGEVRISRWFRNFSTSGQYTKKRCVCVRKGSGKWSTARGKSRGCYKTLIRYTGFTSVFNYTVKYTDCTGVK